MVIRIDKTPQGWYTLSTHREVLGKRWIYSKAYEFETSIGLVFDSFCESAKRNLDIVEDQKRKEVANGNP